jgi:hypothetical protein
MDATLWTGTGSALTISNADNGTTGFRPDLVWGKMRNSADRHYLFNSIAGVTKYLSSNLPDAEVTDATIITSFNSNGFTLGTGNSLNRAGGYNFVGWQWQAGQGTTTTNNVGSISSQVSVNTTAGFSVVTYTGTGANATVGHGLGVTPKMFIVKNRSTSQDWRVYTETTGPNNTLFLNATDVSTAASTGWNNTAPTSSVFSIGTSLAVNQSGSNFVAYCWAQVAGFSQFGSYTGNGSTDGPFVYTGFRPKFLMYKRTDSTGSWFMVDSTRNPSNLSNLWLQANTNEAEQTDTAIDLNSNGYKIRTSGSGTNASGGTYIYMTFAENPFKYANAR